MTSLAVRLVVIALTLCACAAVPSPTATLVPSHPQPASPSETPSPQPSPSPNSDFVGHFGWLSGAFCLAFRSGENIYRLALPDNYDHAYRTGWLMIVNRRGEVIAREGDQIGVNGEIRGRGCLLAPDIDTLRASEIVVVDPGLAPFTIYESQPGVRYPVQIFTQCGLTPAYLDDGWWNFAGQPGNSAPPGFTAPYDVGIVVFADHRSATYTSSGGVTINLTQMESSPSSSPPCPIPDS